MVSFSVVIYLAFSFLLQEQSRKTEEIQSQNHKNGFCNGDLKLRKSKTDSQSNGHVNGHLSNGYVNGHIRQNEKVVQNGHSKYGS